MHGLSTLVIFCFMLYDKHAAGKQRKGTADKSIEMEFIVMKKMISLLMALALVIYCGGTVFYALVHRKVRCSMKIVCMICIAAAIALTGLICFVKSDFIAVYPLIFVAPIQWNAFKTVDCDSSSTIFCSSNVLQATMLTTNFVLTKDRNYARRATVYWMTLLSFVTGATLACIVSMHCGVSGIWFAYLPLALTAFAYLRYYAAKKSENLNQPQG